MLLKAASWTMERLIELVLLAFLAYEVFGSNESSSNPGIIGDLRVNVVYVAYFFVASGYVATTAFFGIFKRPESPVYHALIMVGLYVIHISVWFYADSWDERAPIVVFGACAVAFSSLVGNAVLGLLDKASHPST